LATERPVVSGLGGDGEDNYGDGLTMAAKMVMERWTNYGGGDGAWLRSCFPVQCFARNVHTVNFLCVEVFYSQVNLLADDEYAPLEDRWLLCCMVVVSHVYVRVRA